MSLYGYIYAADPNRGIDDQIVALQEFGISDERIAIDVEGNAEETRPALRKLTDRMAEGDTLVIGSMDHFGRNSREILEQWKAIVTERHLSVVVLDAPMIDTRVGNNHAGVDISQLIAQVISQVSQAEQDFKRRRQAEGIAAAKANGTHFGRKFKDRGASYSLLASMYHRGEISGRQAAKLLGVAHETFRRWVREN